MSNVFEEVGHGLKVAGEAVLQGVEYPIEFLVKAEHVLADAIKEQPAVKSAVIDLVQKAESVIGDVTLATAEKGVNLADDAKALADAEQFFSWFKTNFIPLMSKLYGELKEDVQ
jgi:hypothetical protein